jgi:hypothetical protein
MMFASINEQVDASMLVYALYPYLHGLTVRELCKIAPETLLNRDRLNESILDAQTLNMTIVVIGDTMVDLKFGADDVIDVHL